MLVLTLFTNILPLSLVHASVSHCAPVSSDADSISLNRASRYDIADIAVHAVASNEPNSKIAVKAHSLGSNWKHELRVHEKYVLEHGEDPEWCGQVPEVKDA
jgi:hypothetical protein